MKQGYFRVITFILFVVSVFISGSGFAQTVSADKGAIILGESISYKITFPASPTLWKYIDREHQTDWTITTSTSATLTFSYISSGYLNPQLLTQNTTLDIKTVFCDINPYVWDTTSTVFYSITPIREDTLCQLVIQFRPKSIQYKIDWAEGGGYGEWLSATYKMITVEHLYWEWGLYKPAVIIQDSYGEYTIKTPVRNFQYAGGDMGVFGNPTRGYNPLTFDLSFRWLGFISKSVTCGTYQQSGGVGNSMNLTLGEGSHMVHMQEIEPSFGMYHPGHTYDFYAFGYIKVYSRKTAAPPIDLPTYRLFTGQSQTTTQFYLSDYKPYQQNYRYFIGWDTLTVAALSGDTVLYQGSSTPGTAEVHYGISYMYDPIRLIRQKVQVSSYQFMGLPEIYLSPGESTTLNLSDYCYSLSGKSLAPSIGKTDSLVTGHPGYLLAKWSGNIFTGYKSVKITALSGFTSESYVDVAASPSEATQYTDVDWGHIVIKPRLFKMGNFANLSEFNQHYVLQNLEDYPIRPTSMQVSKPGTLVVSFKNNSEGIRIMPNSEYFMNYQKNKWYTARMTVMCPQKDSFIETHLYNFKGVVPGDTTVQISQNMLLGVSTTWTTIDVPLYTHQAGAGYFQIYLKNYGGTTADVYVKDIEVVESMPEVMAAWRQPKINLKRYYTVIDRPELLWGIEGNCNKWLTNEEVLTMNNYTTMKLTGKIPNGGILTPGVNPGESFGLKSQIIMTKNTGDYNDFFMLACIGVQREGEYNFWEKGNHIISTCEFGELTDSADDDSQGYYYAGGTALNPYYQYQVITRRKNPGILMLRNPEFLTE